MRGLKWVQSHTPEEIAKVMPEEFALGNKEIYIQSIKSNLPAYSPDGKFIPGAAETALKVLQAFDPNVQGKTIDLSKTYTTRFVDKANAGQLASAVPPAAACIAVHRRCGRPRMHGSSWRSRVCGASCACARDDR